ncbi:MAG: acylphosphatase, partial [Gammaproteobacteria bacterium]|nr:acylphosphatase [Gammaproteobacteria bacterium]
MTDGVKIRVSGRVQGVGFRAFVRAQAQRRGVTGYARNLPDGRVEVALYGDADAVAQVRQAVAEG